MNKFIFLFFSFFLLHAFAVEPDWIANKNCIQTIDKLDILPSGYNIVALKSGGIILISSGPDGSIFVTNGKNEALSNGHYPRHTLNLSGSCNSSRVNQNGKEYLESGLSELLSSKTSSNMKKVDEIIGACKDAPAFSETVSKTRNYYKTKGNERFNEKSVQ